MNDRANCVLAVDDDQVQLSIYSRALTRAGYRCVCAQSGAEALERLATDTVDVVVTDLGMPHMSGVAFIQQLRKTHADLPIIVVTGAPGIDSALASIDAGVFRYVAKPVLPVDLIQAVAQASHARALARARHAAYAHVSQHHHPQQGRATPGALTRALESAWLAVQPIVSVRERRVVAYEALLRSRDVLLPDPAKLLSAAEQLGMLPSLSRRVRELASAVVPRLPGNVDLFINVHPHDLLDEQLYLTAVPLSAVASRVVLELTERASLDSVPDARARVSKLRAMGYRLALDDLGAGYAGLNSFALLKPDVVKLDLELIRDVDTNRTKQTLVRTLIDVAQELSTDVVAEGVETANERSTLHALGCTWQQGYLFARPGEPFPAVAW